LWDYKNCDRNVSGHKTLFQNWVSVIIALTLDFDCESTTPLTRYVC